MREVRLTDIVYTLNSRKGDYKSGIPAELVSKILTQSKPTVLKPESVVLSDNTTILIMYASAETENGNLTQIGDKELNFLFEIISKGLKLDPNQQTLKRFEVDPESIKDQEKIQQDFNKYCADVEMCLEVQKVDYVIVLSDFLTKLLKTEAFVKKSMPGFNTKNILYATDLNKISSNSEIKKSFWNDLKIVITSISGAVKKA